MGIEVKILFSIVVICLVLALAVGGVVVHSLRAVREASDTVRLAWELSDGILRLRADRSHYLTRGDAQDRETLETHLKELVDRTQKAQTLPLSEAQRNELDLIAIRLKQCQDRADRFFHASPDEQNLLQNEWETIESEIRRRAQTIGDIGQDAIRSSTSEVTGRTGVAVVTIIVIGLAVGLRMALDLAEPLRRLARMAHRIAEGDLQQRLDVHRRDEVGQLANAFNQMAEKLNEAERWIRATTVSRRFLGEIIRDLRQRIDHPEVAMMDTGRQFAQRLSGTLSDHLAAFEAQGLGSLELETLDPVHHEVTFRGFRLFESVDESDYPEDHFTRGFLAQTVGKLVNQSMNCEETACEAQGFPCCRFVVYPAHAGGQPGLTTLAEPTAAPATAAGEKASRTS